MSLDDLELGQEPVQVGTRRQVEQGEDGLHIAIDRPFGLQAPLQRARESLREERAAEQILGETRELLATQNGEAPGARMPGGV